MSSMIFSSCYHALISGCNWDFSHIVSCSLAFGCHVAHIPLWPAKWPNNKSGFLSSGYPYQEIHETNFSWRMALSCSGVVRVNIYIFNAPDYLHAVVQLVLRGFFGERYDG